MLKNILHRIRNKKNIFKLPLFWITIKKIEADIVFCNRTLTYLNESDLENALQRFCSAKMVIAIHNTTEDNKRSGYLL